MHHVTIHFPLSFNVKVVAQQIRIEPNHLSGGLRSSTHFGNLQKNWISESEVSLNIKYQDDGMELYLLKSLESCQ